MDTYKTDVDNENNFTNDKEKSNDDYFLSLFSKLDQLWEAGDFENSGNILIEIIKFINDGRNPISFDFGNPKFIESIIRKLQDAIHFDPHTKGQRVVCSLLQILITTCNSSPIAISVLIEFEQVETFINLINYPTLDVSENAIKIITLTFNQFSDKGKSIAFPLLIQKACDMYNKDDSNVNSLLKNILSICQSADTAFLSHFVDHIAHLLNLLFHQVDTYYLYCSFIVDTLVVLQKNQIDIFELNSELVEYVFSLLSCFQFEPLYKSIFILMNRIVVDITDCENPKFLLIKNNIPRIINIIPNLLDHNNPILFYFLSNCIVVDPSIIELLLDEKTFRTIEQYSKVKSNFRMLDPLIFLLWNILYFSNHEALNMILSSPIFFEIIMKSLDVDNDLTLIELIAKTIHTIFERFGTHPDLPNFNCIIEKLICVYDESDESIQEILNQYLSDLFSNPEDKE